MSYILITVVIKLIMFLMVKCDEITANNFIPANIYETL